MANCTQNLNGVKNISFPTLLDSYREQFLRFLLQYNCFTVKPGQAFRDRMNFKADSGSVDIIIRFNNALFS